jgi:type IV pilus assembly protein PilV
MEAMSMHVTKPLRGQRGVMLLEALIALLLFSVGILAVVGLQAQSVAHVSQGKYRADAAFLGDQVIGQMWANRANIPSYAYAGAGTAPAAIQQWVTQVQRSLPGATTFPPRITIAATPYVGPPAYTAYNVTVSIFWQTPEEANDTPARPPHNFTTTAYIQCC